MAKCCCGGGLGLPSQSRIWVVSEPRLSCTTTIGLCLRPSAPEPDRPSRPGPQRLPSRQPAPCRSSWVVLRKAGTSKRTRGPSLLFSLDSGPCEPRRAAGGESSGLRAKWGVRDRRAQSCPPFSVCGPDDPLHRVLVIVNGRMQGGAWNTVNPQQTVISINC